METDGQKHNASTLALLFPQIAESLHAFTYLFAKFPETEYDNTRNKVIDVLENLLPEEANDQTFVEVLSDIETKVHPDQFVEPLNPAKKKKLLEKSLSCHL